jgi:CheY-like chemotaxis protein
VSNSALHILVIDNHRDLAEAIGVVLRREGHRVVVARSGAEGLDAVRGVRRDGNPFDVVLTDLTMPEPDGLEVAAAVKEVFASTFVVLLTAHILPDDPVPLHVDAVLSKPPTIEKLRAALAAARSKQARTTLTSAG